MTKDTIVIIYLSLSLLIVQFMLMRSQQRTAFLEGQQSVYNSFAATDNDGTCFVTDCRNNPNGK